MPELNLEALRVAAEAATPGPWKQEGRYVTVSMQQPVICEVEYRETRANAAFIALANPKTILQLIARLEASERELAAFRAQGIPPVVPSKINRDTIQTIEDRYWDNCRD